MLTIRTDRYGIESVDSPAYAIVNKPIEAFMVTGVAHMGAYYGSSAIYERVVEPRTLQVGEELHFLPGGAWVVSADRELSQIIVPERPRGAFEKNYSGTTENELWARKVKGNVTFIEWPGKPLCGYLR